MKHKMILSVSADAKTIKGQTYGYLTGILYLSPANLSGVQLCPLASLAGCEIACLNSAGRGAFNNVQLARLNKAKMFNHDRELFMKHLVFSIQRVVNKAAKLDLIPVIRPNGTSDVAWENIPATRNGIEYKNIFEAFPEVQFYDYTKIPTRSNIPTNYDLTFSISGVESFKPIIAKALKNNNLMRYAVVFSHRERIPTTWGNMKVIDGDNSDLRFLEHANTVVALYAKGKAKKDQTGFVYQV